jgi:hypothetical protein
MFSHVPTLPHVLGKHEAPRALRVRRRLLQYRSYSLQFDQKKNQNQKKEGKTQKQSSMQS